MTDPVKDYFDKRPLSFDSIYLNESPLARWFNETFRRAIYERFHVALEESGDVAGKTVLDVGCGSGRYVVEYAKREACWVVGVDFAPSMLELARALAIREGVRERCEFLQADFKTRRFDAKFDIVLAMGVFDYIDEPVAFLRKMAQVSCSKVIASFPGKSLVRMRLRQIRYRLRNCPLFFYSEVELRRIVEKAGLTNYKLVPIRSSGTGYVLVGSIDT